MHRYTVSRSEWKAATFIGEVVLPMVCGLGLLILVLLSRG